MESQYTAYAVSNSIERTRHYMGGCWTFLVRSKDSHGRFALIEVTFRKGLEPPRHTHTKENETYYILDGELEFTAGEETYLLKAGDCIHLPENIAHHFKLQSNTVKALINICPGGLDDMFWELGKPAEKIGLPPPPSGPPSAEFLEKIRGLQKKYGIIGIDNSQIKAF
jgi:quercetin dioxygenase-like cupin family protein